MKTNMIDREKVIKGLECCIRHGENAEVGCGRKDECPYEQVGLTCWIALNRDALALLKEQEERKGNYVSCNVKTPTGKWNGEKCSVCGTEYIGSAPLQWKFCPDCGTKMEGR